MGDITDFDFQQDAKFGDSYVEDGTALPNNTNYTSDVFELSQVQAALGLKVIADGAVVIANTKTLKLEILHDTEEDGTFTDSETILDYTNSSGVAVTRADGYVFADWVPGREIGKFCKLKVTTTSDLSSYAYDAYIYFAAR